jgi:hypothetical protein
MNSYMLFNLFSLVLSYPNEFLCHFYLIYQFLIIKQQIAGQYNVHLLNVNFIHFFKQQSNQIINLII